MNRPSGAPTVLVLTGDPQAQGLFASLLEQHGMRFLPGAGRAGRSSLRQAPDVVLLDATLPGSDAISSVQRLRKNTGAPIVALLGPTREEDRTALLEAGADDYLVKPFTTEELVVRLRVWLKHSTREGPSTPELQPPKPRAHLRLDRELRCIFVDGLEVHVTPLEYKLLDLLARAGAAGMAEGQLMKALWGRKAPRSVQYLRAHVRRLRQKMEVDAARPRHLLSEPSGTYRLKLG
jgi:two-component system KDP operon response regulator KdpE